MNILVTGGAGYIGSHTAKVLINAGFNITVVDDLSTGFIEALPLGVRFIKGDILDFNFINSIFHKIRFEAVLHMAAKVSVSESIKNPKTYYKNNVDGSLIILKMCEIYKINKFIFSSSALVYSESIQTLISESDKVKPISPYGESKLLFEKALKQFKLKNPLFDFIILRYFNVAGASFDLSNGQRCEKPTHLIKLVSELAVGKRSEIQIYGSAYSTPDGTCIRDYIHVLDLANIQLAALNKLISKRGSHIFNCGYGVGYSVLDVLKIAQHITRLTFNIKQVDPRAGDPPRLVADVSKIKAELNWKPAFQNLELICRSAIDWERVKK